MSTRSSNISNAELLPTFESSLFDDAPDKRFALGILAVADVPMQGLEPEYRGYYDLRRNVYVYETGQLSEAELDADGTDRDIDDARSVAFGAFENLTDGTIRAVGSLRLIMKGHGTDSNSLRELPVEEFCPDIFGENPAAAKSTEVSRLIARHEETAKQEYLAWKLYTAGLAYISNHNLGPTYAVIEPWLEKHFTDTVPVTRIGEPRYIEHYQDYNLPIEVHTEEFMGLVEQFSPGLLEKMRRQEGLMHFSGKLLTHPTVAIA
jgi:hypothetical protein